MRFAKNELKERVYSLFTQQEEGFDGFTCSEVAEIIKKKSKDLNQVLKGLTDSGKLSREKTKKGVKQKIYNYNLPIAEKIVEKKNKKKNKKKICNKCQRYSGLEKCILLKLVHEVTPWALRGELKERFEAISLDGVTGCNYFDPRNSGQCKSKTMKVFIEKNTDSITFEFRCPIKRCKKIIDELSMSLQRKNIGANTLYCPHCGSPIKFGFNQGLNRYQVRFWDSRFDILQRDYERLTGMKLKSRYVEDRSHGFSIVKEGSFYLDFDEEAIYVGNELSPVDFKDSKDLAYYSLKQLNYIAVKHEEDYLYLKQKLHDFDGTSGGALYPKLNLIHSKSVIESVDPTLKEIGGNEILIATGATFYPMFYCNILNRRAALEKKLTDMVEGDLKQDFNVALKLFDRDIKKYSAPWQLSYLEWQRLEGGFGSVMHVPFKKEAEKYGFDNISREKARKVRGEHYMKYGLFTARTKKACLENGVNKVTDNYIKEEIYNVQFVPWDGLRGWCHRRYPFGLFLDNIETPRTVTPIWVNEVIRNEEITPADFETDRGKRFEDFYLIEQNSHAHEVVKRVSKQILQTKVTLTTGEDTTIKRMINRDVSQIKRMLNRLPNFTVDLFLEKKKNSQVKTIWKKLEETNNSAFLTTKEFRLLQKHVRKFFKEEFSFAPSTISRIM
ncbi:MAG: hypothetical protein GNW80_09505 [Asgard group archaeon]|nr:hypothetical protein [Asgard group archaeon]